MATGRVLTRSRAEADLIDSLRIYHIMIAPYRNGCETNGFSCGYGPSHHRGDIPGVTQSLDVISRLGFNALLLSPVFSTGGNGRLDSTAYFPENYFAIDPHFGTELDFHTLVGEAHARGMAVFLDCPFGHHSKVKQIMPTPDGRGKVPSPCTVPDPFGLGYLGVDFSDPDTVDFACTVATWWIQKFGIDGWRADQAYQVHIEGRNCWDKIMKEVRATCLERRARGETWGTLGYMVGEVWRSEQEIVSFGYGPEGFLGLDSCFDFPLRYRLLRVLATEEKPIGKDGTKRYGMGAEVLKRGLDIRDVLPGHAHPNLMIGTHDFPRLGNLIARCPDLGYSREHPDYWKRHRLAISFLAATSGPITLFYGEEFGDTCEGYVNNGDLGYWDSNVSRTAGRFAGSDPRYAAQELELAGYTTSVLHLRAATPALWQGARRNVTASGNVFIEEKSTRDERLFFAINLGPQPADFIIPEDVGLVDALSGDVFRGRKTGTRIPMEGLGSRFLRVLDTKPCNPSEPPDEHTS